MLGMGEDVEDFWDEYCYSLCNPVQSATSGLIARLEDYFVPSVKPPAGRVRA